MNKYDEYYSFRKAKKNDIDEIMYFIKSEWSDSHILANDKEFFIWQYGNEEYGDFENINFVLMLDKNNNIIGTNGYNIYSNNPDRIYVSSSITKVKENLKLPLCGVELIKRFKELVPANAYYSSGTNPKTMLPIGKRVFHYDTGKVQQFYMYNDKLDEYKIFEYNCEYNNAYEKSDYVFCKIDGIEKLLAGFDIEKKYDGQAYKSKEYINKRFFEHPIYRYQAIGIKENVTVNNFKAVVFAREIEAEGRKVLRIVDYLGELSVLGKIGVPLHQLMYEEEYEYIDMMVAKLPIELMEESGFHLRTEEDLNIVPTYFEPFLRENVDIYYQRSNPNIVLFKADGDQDRPNKR